ncbi:PhnD/SsuA/transferrin family substrate-binding protein [Facklamia lactis]|nr:PhnD/SsuA/transferrin family substrate-binding protein [Facklamia lactis]
MSPTSPAGYIYPALKLSDKYDKSIADLSNAVQSDSYLTAFSRLASGQVDILLTYADGHRDYAEQWESELGAENDIWTDTDTLLITDAIFNDTVSVSKNSDTMTDELKEAVAEALINLTEDEKTCEVIFNIYSHEGYEKASDSDYDNERKAQELLLEANN